MFIPCIKAPSKNLVQQRQANMTMDRKLVSMMAKINMALDYVSQKLVIA